MNKKNNKKLLIIYHYPCYDGMVGAINVYLYYRYFSKKYEISFKPTKNIDNLFYNIFNDNNLNNNENNEKIDNINPNNKYDNIEYDKIIIVDLNIKEKEFDVLKKLNNVKIRLFDHHESWCKTYESEKFKSILKENKNILCFYDKNNIKSGCGLTFDYYKEKSIKKFEKINKTNGNINSIINSDKNSQTKNDTNDNNKINIDIDNQIVSLNAKEKVKQVNTFDLFSKDNISPEEIFTDKYKILNEYIEDSDTGNHKLRDIIFFKCALCSVLTPMVNITDLSFKLTQKINILFDLNVNNLINRGRPIGRTYKNKAKKVLYYGKIYLVDLGAYDNNTENKDYINDSNNDKIKNNYQIENINNSIKTEINNNKNTNDNKICTNNSINVINTKSDKKIDEQKSTLFLACESEEKWIRNIAGPLLGKISEKMGYLPIGAFIYKDYSIKNLYHFSMRKKDGSNIDLSVIAAKYGGGGHKGASAFTGTFDEIDNLIIKSVNIKKIIYKIN